jgi:sugar (pentulose or hexulose) kinase
VGKTLSKVSLWSQDGKMLDRQVRPNDKCENGGIRRLDTAGIGAWLIEALGRYSGQPVTAIIPVGHGAGVVALVDDALAFAPLDYEQPIPESVMLAYRTERDPFARTGSPALPDGLNIGSQLYWLELLYPEAMARATLLPWGQYWAWFLSGNKVSEVTSLGCHSDLWHPADACFSDLATRYGWADRFAPLANAGDAIGTLRPDLAARTGLPVATRVLAGLHDSNAALLAARGFAEIASHEATVMSTGTWFIALRSGGRSVGRSTQEPLDFSALPEARDCLINVDAFGRPVPSARFMGGREIETVIAIDTRQVDIKPDQPALLAKVPELLAKGTMLLPTLAPGFGPFPAGTGRWINAPDNLGPDDWHARRAAVCLYAALVTDVMLDLIGARDRILIEGRFAEAEVFTRALAALRPDTAVYCANAHNDVSFGAVRLIHPDLRPQGELRLVKPLAGDIDAYRSRWLAAMGAMA